MLLHVTPAASANSVGPYAEGRLRVRVTRPPAAGEATTAALRAVADALGVPAGRLSLLSGGRSRTKRVAVAGMAVEELERRLRRLAPN